MPTSRATRVTSEANELSWSTIVLMVFFSSRISPFTSTVIFFDRSPSATAVVTSAMLRTWPVRLPAIVHVVGQVLPGAGHALTSRLAAELALGAHLARHARHFGGERAQLVHHRVDGVLQLENSPFTSTVIFLERSPLATAVVTSAMLRTWPVRLPAIEFTLSVRSFHVPGHALHLGLAAELALGAHLAGDARHFGGERAELVHHRVDGLGGAQELALSGRPSISSAIVCDRSPWPRRRSRARPRWSAGQVVDQAVHRVDLSAATPGRHRRGGALADQPVAPDGAPDARELALHPGVRLDEPVEREGQLPPDPLDRGATRAVKSPPAAASTPRGARGAPDPPPARWRPRRAATAAAARRTVRC